jgi:xanthine/CO dehydrogenase XdhC/CoxF family maturation factor
MTDFEHIVPLWRDLESAGAEYVLATIVEVQGSSYRRPGARMLLAQDGRRAGTVSGGCLEAEVAKKAWWLTESGPVVQRYSTLEDDGDLPYGSGCGGVIFVLLERRATARPLLEALYAAWRARETLAIAAVLEGPHIGQRVFAAASTSADLPDLAAVRLASVAPWQVDLQRLAYLASDEQISRDERIAVDGEDTRVWVDYRSARPGLWIFGAGDDTKPLHKLARELGWFVAVADGRSHLATAQRFGGADAVISLETSTLHESAPAALDLRPGDAAVLATHSYEQDTHILAFLLSRAPHQRPAYVGILGPQRRTREALADAARLLGLTPTTKLVDQWLEEINGPTGLDLGADTPAGIALSILAEIQKSLTTATALPLKRVRAMRAVTTE